MAEEVLFNVVGDIIMKLGSQALQEIGLWWGLKDEFEKLKTTLSAIQAVLLDAEEKSAHSNQVRDWLAKLKEVVYDADDLLDDFSTEALRRQVMDGNKVTKEVCLFFSHSNPFVYGIKMGHKIKAIRERLDAIAKDKHQFHLVEHHTETPFMSRDRDQTISYVGEEDVIGRDSDKEEILKLLFISNTDDNVLVIPIVGLGGLGKTTLAQYIYNDGRVINHFELRIWVCVSDVFDIKVIVEKAIKSLTKTGPGNLEMDQLQDDLRNEISGKKYLLVLDDVWNEDLQKWLKLKSLLMCGARGSRIIVTTRSEKVAKITGTVPHYSLGGLSPSQSWSLVKKIVFKGQEPKNPNVRNIGEDIIKKCVGVPLAIKTIASILYLKDPETEWLPFLENDLSKIAQDNVILNTLKLSYDHLSSHLKHCFAYCALFPKDYVIDVKTLIHLWIAQGFVNEPSNKSQCVEDVALEYFKDLWWRSFFQEVERDKLGNVVGCKMHDLMHDLATLVVGRGIKLINSASERVDEKTCHLSIEVKLSLLTSENLSSAKKLRTFFLPTRNDEKHFSIDEVIFSNFRHLRVCDVHGLSVEKLIPSIKKLKQLRYMDVSRTQIEALPNSICELHNLQVLNVSRCEKLKELPKNIRKLINLRHLYNESCYELTHMPHGIGQLTSLLTLSLFVVGNKHSNENENVGGLGELNGLNNLRGSLKIQNWKQVKISVSHSDQLPNLKGKQHLQSLTLFCSPNANDDCDEMTLASLQPHPNLKNLDVEGFQGIMFPTSWFSSLTNLVFLKIEDCKRCHYLPPLNEIPSLEKLEIYKLPDLECIEMEGSTTTFFPSLKHLILCDCPKLMGWKKKREEDDSDYSDSLKHVLQFPCLSEFDCYECPMLTSLPQFPSLDDSLILHIVNAKLLKKMFSSSSCSSSSSSAAPLSKLKKLHIRYISDLESLPADGLQNLTSLEELKIRDCQSLKSLPEEMSYLTSLRQLVIDECPELEKRCGNNNGVDWPHIAHIQNIEVGGKRIQWEGCYL